MSSISQPKMSFARAILSAGEAALAGDSMYTIFPMRRSLMLCTAVISLCSTAFPQSKGNKRTVGATGKQVDGREKLLGKWESSGGGDERYDFNADGTYLRSFKHISMRTQGKFSVSGGTLTIGDDPPKKFRFNGDTLVIIYDDGEVKDTRYAGDTVAGSAPQRSAPTGRSGSTAPMTPERRALEACAQEKGAHIRVISFGPVIPRGGSKVAKMTIFIIMPVGQEHLGGEVDGEAIYEKADDGKWYLTSAHAGFKFGVSCATEVR